MCPRCVLSSSFTHRVVLFVLFQFSLISYAPKGTEAFSPRLDTVRLDGIAADILSEDEAETQEYGSLFTCDEDVSEQPATISELPSFSGWLSLNGAERGAQKMWVVIKGSHLLWSKKEIKIEDDKSFKERRQFENWMSVLNMKGIRKLKGKFDNSFAVVIAGTTKAYMWKAANKDQRDDWVEEIKAHRRHVMSMLDEKKYIIKKYIVSDFKKGRKQKKFSKKKRSNKH